MIFMLSMDPKKQIKRSPLSVEEKEYEDIVTETKSEKASNEVQKLFDENLIFKKQHHNSHAFLRLKIRLKKEIVTMGDTTIKSNNKSGKYLTPEEWDELVTKNDVIVIDTRNYYESDIGTFKNAIKVNTNNFREFPQWFKNNKEKFSQCFACRSPISIRDQNSKLFKEGVSCPKCFNNKNKKQVKRYQERQKQIKIAKKKGIKHLG